MIIKIDYLNELIEEYLEDNANDSSDDIDPIDDRVETEPWVKNTEYW